MASAGDGSAPLLATAPPVEPGEPRFAPAAPSFVPLRVVGCRPTAGVAVMAMDPGSLGASARFTPVRSGTPCGTTCGTPCGTPAKRVAMALPLAETRCRRGVAPASPAEPPPSLLVPPMPSPSLLVPSTPLPAPLTPPMPTRPPAGWAVSHVACGRSAHEPSAVKWLAERPLLAPLGMCMHVLGWPRGAVVVPCTTACVAFAAPPLACATACAAFAAAPLACATACAAFAAPPLACSCALPSVAGVCPVSRCCCCSCC
eukprot:356693-Chlamydomonas_euryale.AAC.2